MEKIWVETLIRFCMVKNKKRLIDSSVVMALFNEEDSQYEKAIEVFSEIKREKLLVKISCITIIELVSLLKYRKIKGWQRYSEKLLDGSLFLVDNAYFLDPNDLSWKLTLNEENIGMVDAIEIEHCLLNDEELISFDKKQIAVYKRLTKGKWRLFNPSSLVNQFGNIFYKYLFTEFLSVGDTGFGVDFEFLETLDGGD